VPEAARRAGRDDLYFTIEHGAMGGWPQVGGVSRNPEGILGQLEVFQYYEGGGPDVSVLSFGQIDRHGNVNVSRFGSMMPGCGGFTNIVHGVRRLIFCGTLTTGGAVSQVGDGRLDIVSEGSIARFVDEVEQITFNAARALDAGHEITVVTDRGIFEVTTSGFELVRVAPGVELRRDVLDRIAFEVRVSPRLEVIDAGFFGGSR
jgi:acyl CoA:acetate/3-ketoacid CoA transferase